MFSNLVHLSAFLAFLAVAQAGVTIRLVGYWEPTTFYCTDVRPSQCCKVVSYGLAGGCMPTFMFNTFLSAQFYDLPPRTLAASFLPRFGVDENCNGRIKYSKFMADGGDATLVSIDDLAYQPSVTGAGYIKCGDPKPSVGWLSVIAGLCVSFKDMNPRSWLPDNLAPRDEVPSSVYPDIITINGTNYTDGRIGNLMYKSISGELLNLNPIGGTDPWTGKQCSAVIEAQLYCWTNDQCRDGEKCETATSADLNILMGAKVPQVRICVAA
ncbi:MAG: hypothetical protein M1812_005557 [Candelaria pacifica]|nr:MAG: hypothetical protein M1812_005557 [Candelaria pacifica]